MDRGDGQEIPHIGINYWCMVLLCVDGSGFFKDMALVGFPHSKPSCILKSIWTTQSEPNEEKKSHKNGVDKEV